MTISVQRYEGALLRAQWPYLDSSGNVLGIVARYDSPHGKKVIPFFRLVGGSWKPGGVPACRKLFNLDQLSAAPDRPVLVVEGEKCAEALKWLGFVSTTSLGGSSAPGKTDWSPLSGRGVVWILADNDESGRRYANEVHEILNGLDDSPKQIFVILFPDLPEGGDVVDLLQKHCPDWDGLSAIPKEEAERLRKILASELKERRTKATEQPVHEEVTATGEPSWPPLQSLEHRTADFPTSVFTGEVEDMVQALAEETETPYALAATLALAVIASIIQKRVWVRITDSFCEPTCIWICSMLPPANRKTEVLKRLMSPIVRWEMVQVDSQSAALLSALAENKAIDAKLEKLKRDFQRRKSEISDQNYAKQIQELESQRHTLPSPPRIVVDDITPESLAEVLKQQGEAIGLLSDEGGIFRILGGLYSKNGAGPNRNTFLKSHSASPIRVDRKTAGQVVVLEAPRLTMGLAIQPEIIESLKKVEGLRGEGFLARFLYFLLESNLGRRRFLGSPVPDDVESAYRRLVTGLLEICSPAEKSNQPNNIVLTLAPDAQALLCEFRAALEPRMGKNGDLVEVQDWAGKLVGAVGRLAGNLWAAEAGASLASKTQIHVDCVSRAISIAEAAIPHALSAFDMMSHDSELGRARKLIEKIEGKCKKKELDGIVTVREVERLMTCKATDARRLLKLLERHGYVRESASQKLPGRPKLRYQLSPVWLQDLED